MAEKDVTEKTLESYNDVFADIVNTLMFNGKQVVDPDDLEDQLPRSLYKADGKFREIERDVAKRWKKHNIRIACIGLENQTESDRYMTLRVAGYDRSEYRAQMNSLGKGAEPYPVITLVLYFGYKKHWDQPTTLFEALNVPDDLKPFVNDVRLNLFEVAYLPREKVNLFHSDFKIVADYFVQMQENGNYDPGTETVDHIQEVLQLLNVLDRDHRFEEKINEGIGKGESKTMSEWLSRVIDESEAKGRAEGEAKGLAEGEAKGLAEGENRLGNLIGLLLNLGRSEDAYKAASDPEYRNLLYREFGIA